MTPMPLENPKGNRLVDLAFGSLGGQASGATPARKAGPDYSQGFSKAVKDAQGKQKTKSVQSQRVGHHALGRPTDTHSNHFASEEKSQSHPSKPSEPTVTQSKTVSDKSSRSKISDPPVMNKHRVKEDPSSGKAKNPIAKIQPEKQSPGTQTASTKEIKSEPDLESNPNSAAAMETETTPDSEDSISNGRDSESLTQPVSTESPKQDGETTALDQESPVTDWSAPMVLAMMNPDQGPFNPITIESIASTDYETLGSTHDENPNPELSSQVKDQSSQDLLTIPENKDISSLPSFQAKQQIGKQEISDSTIDESTPLVEGVENQNVVSNLRDATNLKDGNKSRSLKSENEAGEISTNPFSSRSIAEAGIKSTRSLAASTEKWIEPTAPISPSTVPLASQGPLITHPEALRVLHSQIEPVEEEPLIVTPESLRGDISLTNKESHTDLATAVTPSSTAQNNQNGSYSGQEQNSHFQLNTSPVSGMKWSHPQGESSQAMTFENFSSEAANHNSSTQTRLQDIQAMLKREMDMRATTLRQNGKDEIQIQLTPEHLGRVRVALEMHEGAVTAHIQVQSEAAKAAVDQGMQQLRDNLLQHGFRIEGLNVSVEDRHANLFNPNGENGNRHFNGRDKHGDSETLIEGENPAGEVLMRRLGYNTMEITA